MTVQTRSTGSGCCTRDQPCAAGEAPATNSGRNRAGAIIIFIVSMLLATCKTTQPSDALPPVTPMTSRAVDLALPVHRIAFGSCYAPQLEAREIWPAIEREQPQLVLLTGDNVYQSEERAQPGLRELREAYAMLAAEPEFQSLRQRATIITTWDDHDYGLNDAGADFPLRTESEALFESVWPAPEGVWRAPGPGVYGELLTGPVGLRIQLLILDTRSFRDPWPTGDLAVAAPAELLGEAQWSGCAPGWLCRLIFAWWSAPFPY